MVSHLLPHLIIPVEYVLMKMMISLYPKQHCIRRITRDGVVTTISGSLKNGSQDGSLNMASFYHPRGICLDQNGDIIVADTYNHKIRRLSLKNSIVSTICGTGKSGFKDGDSMTALLNRPFDVCTNSKGHIIIADYSNHRIRMLKDGMISTICGTGSPGSIDGVASVASFNHPTGVCVDKHDNTIISDCNNHKIRMMTNGRVMTVGGNGSQGLSNGNIKSSSFNCPRSVCVDNKGDIIVSDE